MMQTPTAAPPRPPIAALQTTTPGGTTTDIVSSGPPRTALAPRTPPGAAQGAGNTISHSIMAAHGASSTAFLQHLQQTWDLHNSMQAEAVSLKQTQKDLVARNAALVRERDELAQRANTQSSELARLRESNNKVKTEVAAMRDQLARGPVGQGVQERPRPTSSPLARG